MRRNKLDNKYIIEKYKPNPNLTHILQYFFELQG